MILSPVNAARACVVLLGCLASASTAVAGPATDADVKVKYRIAWVGIDLATATFAARLDHGLYTTRLGYRTSGIARLGVAANGDVSSTGAIDGQRLTPTSFSQISKENAKDIRVSLAFQNGNVKSSEAVPEPPVVAERVPIREENKRGVLDPMTALLIPLARPKEGLATACNRTIPIFDGWARYDLTLSLKSEGQYTKAHYNGPSVTCAVRWTPLAARGHPCRDQHLVHETPANPMGGREQAMKSGRTAIRARSVPARPPLLRPRPESP